MKDICVQVSWDSGKEWIKFLSAMIYPWNAIVALRLKD